MSHTPPTILITGAGGFLGRRLAIMARARGFAVRSTVRPGSDVPADIEGSNICEIDLTADVDAWHSVLSGTDIVVHAAARAHILRETNNPVLEFHAQNVEATRRIAQAAARAGVRRFVLVSSIGVLGNTSGGSAFVESTAGRPVTAYAASKLAAEEALHQVSTMSGLETTIVRPPLVYGPDVKGNFRRLLSLVEKAPPLPLGGLRNTRSMIYVDNLADLLLTAGVHDAAAGETFVAEDGTNLSTPELWRELATRMNRPARLFPAPKLLLLLLARMSRRQHMYEQLCESLEVDASKARERLEWVAPITPSEGLDATVRWYLERKHLSST